MDIQGKINGDKATGTGFFISMFDNATLNIMTYAMANKRSSVSYLFQ
jgi:hypothetical protein